MVRTTSNSASILLYSFHVDESISIFNCVRRQFALEGKVDKIRGLFRELEEELWTGAGFVQYTAYALH